MTAWPWLRRQLRPYLAVLMAEFHVGLVDVDAMRPAEAKSLIRALEQRRAAERTSRR